MKITILEKGGYWQIPLEFEEKNYMKAAKHYDVLTESLKSAISVPESLF